jgi:hypothetical protein
MCQTQSKQKHKRKFYIFHLENGGKHVMCQTQSEQNHTRKSYIFRLENVSSYFSTCEQITYRNKFLTDNWLDETLHFRPKSVPMLFMASYMAH